MPFCLRPPNAGRLYRRPLSGRGKSLRALWGAKPDTLLVQEGGGGGGGGKGLVPSTPCSIEAEKCEDLGIEERESFRRIINFFSLLVKRQNQHQNFRQRYFSDLQLLETIIIIIFFFSFFSSFSSPPPY
ncbi:hypothetical protein E2320_012695 [Naja naja]|nr:hypothetical protein E2320_012695 [Naja naja]